MITTASTHSFLYMMFDCIWHIIEPILHSNNNLPLDWVLTLATGTKKPYHFLNHNTMLFLACFGVVRNEFEVQKNHHHLMWFWVVKLINYCSCFCCCSITQYIFRVEWWWRSETSNLISCIVINWFRIGLRGNRRAQSLFIEYFLLFLDFSLTRLLTKEADFVLMN